MHKQKIVNVYHIMHSLLLMNPTIGFITFVKT